MNTMVAVHYDEQSFRDEDYGKRKPIDLFESREAAVQHLTGVGFKETDRGDEYILKQYHSEVLAVIHTVRRTVPQNERLWEQALANLGDPRHA